MKKLYSLLAVAMFSVAAISQTVIIAEDFASAANGNNTTTTGSNSPWAGSPDFPDAGNVKVYQAGGAIKLGSGSSVGIITSKQVDLSVDGGNFTVTFDVKGWTTVEGGITVTATGLPPQTVTYNQTSTGTFENITLSFGGGAANSTITFETTSKRAFLDNIAVTTLPIVLGVTDLSAIQNNFVKNTSVTNEINFGTRADVKIFSMNGQVVKSASVSENKNLEVADLAPGMYIVTGMVDGQPVSTKIVKK